MSTLGLCRNARVSITHGCSRERSLLDKITEPACCNVQTDSPAIRTDGLLYRCCTRLLSLQNPPRILAQKVLQTDCQQHLAFQNATNYFRKQEKHQLRHRKQKKRPHKILTLHFDEARIHWRFLSLRFPPHVTPQIICSSFVSTPDWTCCSPQPWPHPCSFFLRLRISCNCTEILVGDLGVDSRP